MVAIDEGQAFDLRTEEDAWALLDALRKGEIEISDVGAVRFGEWARVKVYIPSATYDASLTPYMMEGWVELQRSIFRAYGITRTGARSGRRLTEDEKRRLELVVRVRGGSSDQSVDLNSILTEIGKAMVEKMGPEHIVMIVVSVALVYAGQSVFRDWLNGMRDVKLAEISAKRETDQSKERVAALNAVVAVATHDPERMRVMQEAATELPVISEIQEEAREGREALVRHMSKVDAEVNDVPISSAASRIITTKTRVDSEDVRLDGVYTILRVDTEVATGFRVHLRGSDGTKLVSDVAEVMTTLEDRDVIREAEWKKIPVFLQINGRKRRDEVIDATIIRARAYDPETDG
uniref:Uncharacterized protein n=1 Tax=Cereibacter sphaeroides (strain ATCC 17025 / ATH 2.4.3) TaxID=349102 RepID=A4WS27_CERS5